MAKRESTTSNAHTPAVPSAAELEASIRQELKEEPNRGISVDRDAIRGAARQGIQKRLAAAEPHLTDLDDDGTPQPAPELAPVLRQHAQLIDASIGRLDALVLRHSTRSPANRQFSPAAHAAARLMFKQFQRTRNMIRVRTDPNDVDEEIRDGCGVSVTVTEEDVGGVRDASARMVTTLTAEAHAQRFAARAIDLRAHVIPLKRLLADLQAAIGSSESAELTRGESTAVINAELRFLDLTLERTKTFLADHADDATVEAFEVVVPRNRRAGDAPADLQKAAEEAAKKAEVARVKAEEAAKKAEEARRAEEGKKGEG